MTSSGPNNSNAMVPVGFSPPDNNAVSCICDPRTVDGGAVASMIGAALTVIWSEPEAELEPGRDPERFP